MVLCPRQNSSFYMQSCCFELMLVFIWLIWSNTVHSLFNIHISKSNIQLLSFNIVHWQFNIHISNTIHMRHSGLYFFFTNERPYFKSNFPSFTCDIRLFHYDVDAWCVCYGAECDILATQCHILVRTLDFTFEWAHLKMVSRCAKTCELKIP